MTNEKGPSMTYLQGRCLCMTPAGTRCLGIVTEQDGLCDPCRVAEPVGDDGQHWCARSSTPPSANECGAGNVAAFTHRLTYVACTLPAGHPEWTQHENGYSYNHYSAVTDEWWNDGS